MPTLTWAGKEKVANHHHEVPYRVLRKQESFKTEIPNSEGNRIIHGDNLEALKSLLPEFDGAINCIYIDPPYNTGNEKWVYNDNVNDPRLLKWLGKIVGKEGEDMSRHDKWLCMMYPRLKLLHRLLHKNGVILISVDENEYHSLKLVMDEIFGRSSYLGTIAWKTRNVDNRVKTRLSIDHEQVLVYGKRSTAAVNGRVIDRSDFKNHDDDPRGVYTTDPLTGKATAEERENLHYTIVNEATGDVYEPDPSRGWITDRAGYEALLAENRITWPTNPKKGNPRKKRFLWETSERMPLSTFWPDIKGQSGADELDRIMGSRKFPFPKSIEFMTRVLDIACGKDALILDSFAGSGTTGHAALQLNANDGGNRRFILIETMPYAKELTVERIRRVMNGYNDGEQDIPGLGGAFDFYTTGEPLFENDLLNEKIDIETIRNYIAYSEGIKPSERWSTVNPYTPYLLGLNEEMAWVFNYEPGKTTSLDTDFLSTLKFGSKKPKYAIIYADRCLLSKEILEKIGIKFKKIPRDISRF